MLSLSFAAASDNITSDTVTYISSGSFDDVQDDVNTIEENGIIEINVTYHEYGELCA